MDQQGSNPGLGRLIVASEDGRGRDLPVWARALLTVGATVSHLAAGTLAVVAVPTSAYAGPLIATAIIANHAGRPGSHNARRWLNKLRTLKPDSPVSLIEGTKVRVATFLAVEQRDDGLEYVHLKERGKRGLSAERWIRNDQCLRVVPRPRGARIGAGGAYRLPDRVFLEAILPATTATEFVLHGSEQCLIIGGVNQVKAESLRPAFGVLVGGSLFSGRLQSVMRLRNLIGVTGHYRSEVIAGDRDLEAADEGSWPFVLLNGADAFLGPHGNWPNSVRVVILDRSDPGLADAAEALGAAYSARRTDASRINSECPAIDAYYFGTALK